MQKMILPGLFLFWMNGIISFTKTSLHKNSSGSELDMFSEFTMVSEERLSECFGFTEKEVDIVQAE